MQENRKPVFVNVDGTLSDDGRKLATWLEHNLAAMENASAAELNQYPGAVKYLFTQNKAIKMSPERFVQDFGRTYAMSAWHIMEATQAQAQQAEQVQAATDKTSVLESELEKIREEFKKELKAVKSENTKLKNKIKAMEADEVEEDDDQDEPAAAEPETDEAEDSDEAE